MKIQNNFTALLLVCTVSLIIAFLPGTSIGAGFAIIEQSVSGLGNAYAGGAAVAEDATTIFYNPAGLTRLKGQQVVGALHIIFPRADFSDKGSSVSSLLGGAPLTGGDGGDGGEAGYVPNAYYAISLNNGLAFGLGINAPFGLTTDWDDRWQGRYHAIRSDVKIININPAVAYKLNNHFSIGAGISAQYVDAELTNAIDFGSIAFAQTGGAFGTPQGSDGKVEITADDRSYGWNIGLLYEFNENTRIGLSYRSDIDYTVEGDADFFVPSVITGVPLIDAGIAAQFASTEAEADITLPGSASLSGYHRINPQWAVMADITWTNWSEFDELRVEFDPNSFGLTLSDNVTTHDWDDSWRYSAGAVYNHNENLAFRLGVAYDETPIPDEEHRTPRVPGEDRVWTAIGLGYAFNDSVSIDLGYVHLFVDDADINRPAGTDPNGEDFFRGSLVGEFEHSVDIISAQIAITF